MLGNQPFLGKAGWERGGWVVETVQPEPLHGGAVVFVDEHLDAVFMAGIQ